MPYANNYRTHKVTKVELTEKPSTDVGPAPTAENSSINSKIIIPDSTTEVKTAENGAESAQEATEATGEETTYGESEKPRESAQAEMRDKMLTYLLGDGSTEAEVKAKLEQMPQEARNTARQVLAEAMNSGEAAKQGGVYRRTEATAQMTGRTGKTGLVGDRKGLSRKEARSLDTLGKRLGISVEIVDQLGDGKQGCIVNGKAMVVKNSPALSVAAHEATHWMQQTAPEEYSAFRDYAAAEYGDYLETAVREYQEEYRKLGQELTREEALDELAADYAGELLEDEESYRRLVGENRSLARRILEGLRDLIRRITKNGETTELRKLTEAERLWTEMLNAAEKNKENARDQNTLQGREIGATINEKTVKTEEGTNNDERRARGTEKTAQENRQNEGRKGAVQGTATETVRRGTVLGGQRGLTPSFGEKPNRTWAEGHTVEPVRGSAAYAEQQTAMEYGVPSFVVADDAWDANKGKTPAFSANGQIYFKESVPQRNAGMLAYHELTHVMKQAGYEPYLEFTRRVAERMNMGSDAAHLLLENEARHRKIDIFGEDGTLDLRKLHKLNDAERLKLYDELNATLYGHIGSGKLDGLNEYLETAFYDFSSYAAELREIHEGFKQRANAERNKNSESGLRETGGRSTVETNAAKASAETGMDTVLARKESRVNKRLDALERAGGNARKRVNWSTAESRAKEITRRYSSTAYWKDLTKKLLDLYDGMAQGTLFSVPSAGSVLY